jgi:Copper transport outer membrane protein, MctB
MEQLRVLAGEPLLVIDFRYHLVSLIAVFLAVALGIVIGTTALNQPLLSDIKGQVSKLEQDKRGLEDQTRTLQSQVDQAGAFEDAVAPALVGGSLTGRKVLLVVTDDKVSGDTVDQVSALVGQAGGAVSGTLHLQPQFTDPNKASAIQSYVTGAGVPGVTLPPTDDSKQLVATLLADVLMIQNGQTATPADSAAISSVLAGLSALNVLAQDSSSVTPADYAVVLTGAAFTGKDAKTRNAALVDLAAALDAAGSGAVVAGDATTAGDNGLVSVIRDNPTVSTAVSTVDNVTTAAGQISTVLALGRERQGTSGKYGTGPDTQPVPPVPGATQ